MTCAYLIGKYLQSCSASRDVYIPSEYEFKEYCGGAFHTLCPLFSLRRSQEGQHRETAAGSPDPDVTHRQLARSSR